MSKFSLKKFFQVLVLSCISIMSFSQDIKSKGEIGKEWQTLDSRDGINFEVRKTECSVIEGQKPLIYTFLKLSNETNVDKTVHFNFGLQFKEGCAGCETGYEFTVDIIVPAMSHVENDCSFKNHLLSRLITNPNLAGGWKFENILLSDLIIE